MSHKDGGICIPLQRLKLQETVTILDKNENNWRLGKKEAV